MAEALSKTLRLVYRTFYLAIQGAPSGLFARASNLEPQVCNKSMSENRKAVLVKDVLGKVLRDKNWHNRLGVNQVFLFWDDVVGEEIADYAQPDVFKRDILWVKVTDSVRMHQLHFKKLDILAKINQRFLADHIPGKSNESLPEIIDIKFCVARGEVKKTQKQEFEQRGFADVDPNREHEFGVLVKSIENKELRDRLQRVWLNFEKRLD